MLVNLHVRNIALIDDVEIDFTDGFNVLTGETGAGKSLIIDSVNFALGGKVPKDIVREDADYALCELTFQVNDAISDELKKMGIFMEDDYVIMQRRIVNGRGNAKINGETVTAATLKEVANLLIDIHGQHEHQSLLYKKKHLEILDSYAGEELERLKVSLKSSFSSYSSKKQELDSFLSSASGNERELSFIKYEIDEIKNAKLIVGEDEDLEQQYRRMNNSRKLAEAVSSVHQLCGYDSSDGAGSSIGRALSKLKVANDYDSELDDIVSQLSDIDSLMNDFNRELADYEQNLLFSDADYNQVEERLNTINRLKSKYGSSIDMILNYLKEKEAEVVKYENYDEYVDTLKNECDILYKEFIELCHKISIIRVSMAKVLEKEIQNALQDLNFLEARFEISIISDDSKAGSLGCDDVEFLISTNPGEKLRPLLDVASGGELSRIMLAIKTVLAEKDDIDTLIFDEIDTGISGRTAQMVSEKIALLSRSHQVICITHLPQIAAMGDSNFLIAKSVEDGRTVTGVNRLDDDCVVDELARMISGAEITETVLESAKEMKKLADNVKFAM